jgi:hypothetical protein
LETCFEYLKPAPLCDGCVRDWCGLCDDVLCEPPVVGVRCRHQISEKCDARCRGYSDLLADERVAEGVDARLAVESARVDGEEARHQNEFSVDVLATVFVGDVDAGEQAVLFADVGPVAILVERVCGGVVAHVDVVANLPLNPEDADQLLLEPAENPVVNADVFAHVGFTGTESQDACDVNERVHALVKVWQREREGPWCRCVLILFLGSHLPVVQVRPNVVLRTLNVALRNCPRYAPNAIVVFAHAGLVFLGAQRYSGAVC